MNDGKVDPLCAFELCQVVLVNELLGGNVLEFDVHVLQVFQRSGEVEVLDIEAHKARSRSRQHAVDHQLDELEQTFWDHHVTRIEYVAVGDCDLCSVGIILFRLHFADNAGVADVATFVGWDVFVFDDRDGVCLLHLLFLCPLVSFANTLAQVSKFICVRDSQRVFELCVAS